MNSTQFPERHYLQGILYNFKMLVRSLVAAPNICQVGCRLPNPNVQNPKINEVLHSADYFQILYRSAKIAPYKIFAQWKQ